MEEIILVLDKMIGENKRVAPHALSPNLSPDCQNCRCFDGKTWRLGARTGRQKYNTTAYTASVFGVHVADYLFVATDNGNTVSIAVAATPYSGSATWNS